MQMTSKMRNVQFKLRPFLLVAMILMVGFLAFNIWGLSTQNTDLLKSMDSLEDNLKICTRRQKELEEQLGLWKKKYDESQQESRKLSSELKQKETLITAQADEASKWGDKVRILEGEVEKFKSSLHQKENEVSLQSNQILKLQKQLTDSLASKETELREARAIVAKLQAQVNPASQVQSVPEGQLPNNLPVPAQRRQQAQPGLEGVQIKERSINGMLFHGAPLLPREWPGVSRPKPRFSVADLGKLAIPGAGELRKPPSPKPADMVPGLAKPNLEPHPKQNFIPEGRYQVVNLENQLDDNAQKRNLVNDPPKAAVVKDVLENPANAAHNGEHEVPVLALPNPQGFLQQEIDLESERKLDIPVGDNKQLELLNRPEDDENDANEHDHDFEGDQADI